MLSQDFKKLFLDGEKCDLTLRVVDKEFKVHQNILMARCQVFAAMLTHEMIEKNKGIIDVPDCEPQAMEQLLLYIYSGKVEALNPDNAVGLYYASYKYQMMPLKEECSKFLKKSLSPSIVCDVVQLALNHSDNDLLEYATEYFGNHMSEILPTLEWMSFLKSNMVAANELLIKSTKKCHCKKS